MTDSDTDRTVVSTQRWRRYGKGDASASSRIRALLLQGLPTAEIAQRIGCPPGLVHIVKFNMKASGVKLPKQPRSQHGGYTGLAAIPADLVALVNLARREDRKLRTALLRIQHLVAEALRANAAQTLNPSTS